MEYNQEDKFFSIKEACLLVEKVLRALSSLHKQGIIHTNIKPENILIRTKVENDRLVREVKITDIMAASIIGEDNIKPSDYRAPECRPEYMMAMPTGPQADIYSVGNTMKALDFKILKSAKPAINNKLKQVLNYPIKSTNRTVGAIISNEISKIHGSEGLPKDTLTVNFTGTAGQSFGAFTTKGVSLIVSGTCNDYFGKGLSGGRLVVKVPDRNTLTAHQNIIIGNVALYGAINGEVYINGIAGERFCVRNSGATAVVEGIGDHGCEYMTGGIAVILGKHGRNFAAGMSGGIAYIYNEDGNLKKEKFNLEMIELENLQERDFLSLKKLLKNHVKYTSSDKGSFLLKDFSNQKHKFVKVMPTDYKKALIMLENEKVKEKVK